MSRVSLLPKKNSPYSFIAALVLGATLTISASVWATTIGNDVDVSGALTTTGSLTSNGNSTLGNASGDTLTVNATSTFAAGVTINAGGLSVTAGGLTVANAATISGAFNVGGATTLDGNVTLGNAAADVTTFTSGDLRYSNAGTTTIPASSAVAWAYATSSSAGRAFVRFDTANTFVGIGTSTPAAALDVGGDGSLAVTSATGTATATITIKSRGTTRGGCIELESVDGVSVFRLYATATALAANSGGVEYAPAVFEIGRCR